MALFSFRHSVRTFSEKRTAGARAAKHGQTAAHLRYITRPQAARTVLRERLRKATDAKTAEAAEKEAATRKGRVCERFIIALPIEASHEQREALVQAFCEEITQGVAGYVAAIHDKSGNDTNNPHAHIAAFDVQVKTGGRGRPRSTLGMARKNAVEKTAALWATIHNRMMDEWGFGSNSHITHLSYATRSIDRIPQIHEGAGSRALARKGEDGASKPDWHHIDEGHSRAEANTLIKEINAIKEVENEQSHEHTQHRLGKDDEEYRRKCQGRSGDDRARGERPGRDAGDTPPPFAAFERPRNGSRGNQEEADPATASTPPFLTTSPTPTPPPFADTRSLRRRSVLRRLFRELVMLRDTLRARLFNSNQADKQSPESDIQTKREVRQKTISRAIERD